MIKVGKTQRRILSIILDTDIEMLKFFSLPDIYGQLYHQDKYFENIRIANFKRSFEYLVRQKLICQTKTKDGYHKVSFTKKGKKVARKFYIFSNSITFNNKKEWDKMWRIVVFDIPEKFHDFRDLLRQCLKDAGFVKLQNSVFICPHPYEEEVAKLIDLYSADEHVRIITATDIDNKKELINQFFHKEKK